MVGLCEAAQLTPHAGAEAYWTEQATQKVQPASRKIKMMNGQTPSVLHIQNGNTSGVKRTAAQKTDSNARKSSSQRAYGQKNWLESAGIKAFCSLFETLCPDQLEYSALPDGLNADLLVRHKDMPADQWAAVQVKTSKAHPGERMQYHVKKADGQDGGKYKGMIILALGLGPCCQRPQSSEFDEVASALVTDIVMYQNASEMPGKILAPMPRQSDKEDAYGDNRYSAGVDSPTHLQEIMELFLHYVDTAPKFTRYQAWFCPKLNHHISKTHRSEVVNLRVLADRFEFHSLGAPLAQNETVDVVLTVDNVAHYVSVKTVRSKGSLGFNTGSAPNHHFCNAVMAFYVNKTTQQRTHVSVIDAKEVYDGKKKSFNWSKKHKPDVLKHRIALTDSDAAQQIKNALQKIKSKET